MLLTDWEGWEGLYGPAASHSEHHRGDHICYYLASEAEEFTGTIIWICAPTLDCDRHLCYVVENDVWGGIPDIVFPSDVLTSRGV